MGVCAQIEFVPHVVGHVLAVAKGHVISISVNREGVATTPAGSCLFSD